MIANLSFDHPRWRVNAVKKWFCWMFCHGHILTLFFVILLDMFCGCFSPTRAWQPATWLHNLCHSLTSLFNTEWFLSSDVFCECWGLALPLNLFCLVGILSRYLGCILAIHLAHFWATLLLPFQGVPGIRSPRWYKSGGPIRRVRLQQGSGEDTGTWEVTGGRGKNMRKRRIGRNGMKNKQNPDTLTW